MENDSLSSSFTKLFEQIKKYLNLRIEYVKLGIAEYMIRFFSSLVLWIVLFWILFFIVVFLSFAFAYWFGELTGMWSLGFLIIAGFYVVLAFIIYALRKAIIIKPFTRLIIGHLEIGLKKDLEDDKKK